MIWFGSRILSIFMVSNQRFDHSLFIKTLNFFHPSLLLFTMFETKLAPTQASNNKSYSIQITTIDLNSNLCWSLSMMMYIHGQVKLSYLTSEKKASAREDPTLPGMLKTPWLRHGLWTPRIETSSPIICVIQQQRNFKMMLTRCILIWVIIPKFMVWFETWWDPTRRKQFHK